MSLVLDRCRSCGHRGIEDGICMNCNRPKQIVPILTAKEKLMNKLILEVVIGRLCKICSTRVRYQTNNKCRQCDLGVS